MIIFDTLDHLESYVPLQKLMQHVITIMDRSLPYDNPPGSYVCKECKEVTYQVEALLTSSQGVSVSVPEGTSVVEITLEGESLLSLEGESAVYKNYAGRFVLVSGVKSYRSAIAPNGPHAIKLVRFSLHEDEANRSV